jgi:hypothetical protein
MGWCGSESNFVANASSYTMFFASCILPFATSSIVRTSSSIAWAVDLYFASKSFGDRTASVGFDWQAKRTRRKVSFFIELN